jgi:hypothetical protein
VRLGAADRRGDAEVQQKRRRHRLDAAVQTSPAGAAPAATAVAGAATAARNGDADRPPHAGCRADILALGARYRACVSSRLEAAGTRVFIAAEQALDAAARQSDAIVVVLAAAAQARGGGADAGSSILVFSATPGGCVTKLPLPNAWRWRWRWRSLL